MSLGFYIIRLSTACRPPAASQIAKYLSNSCNDGKSSHKPWSYCQCCNRPSAGAGGNKGTKNMYNSRKYSPNLPTNAITPCFEPLPGIPTGVFRNTCGETLGPQGQASKCGMYKSPEYFSYHHMTYDDMHMALKRCRKPRLETGRKPL